MYPSNFLNVIKSVKTQGCLIYVDDGQQLKVNAKIKKIGSTSQSNVEKFINSGIFVLYYGNELHKEIECYITKERLEKEQGKRDQSTLLQLPIFTDEVLESTTVDLSSCNIYGVRSMSIMVHYPAYISNFEQFINARSIFNQVSGVLDVPSEVIDSHTVPISVIPALNCKVVRDDKVDNRSKLLVFPKWLLTDEQFALQSSLMRKVKRKISKSGLNRVVIKTIKKSFKLHTLLPVEEIIELPNLASELLSYLLVCSYGVNVKCDPEELENRVMIFPQASESYGGTDNLFNLAMQLRKTVVKGQSMGLVVIAKKGSVKSGYRRMMEEAGFWMPIVDSDVYGKWVSLQLLSPDYSEDVYKNLVDLKLDLNDDDTPSYFELLMTKIISGVDNIEVNVKEYERAVKVFCEQFGETIESKSLGINLFQHYVYEKYGTTGVLLMLHTTIEANLLSGAWQHVVISPIHDTLNAISGRNRDRPVENVLLHDAYISMTAFSSRYSVTWLELTLGIYPEGIERIKGYGTKLLV
ncbi:MAG: NTP-binding domain protein [Diaphorina citri cimodo-like virus]|nr:MAG: NTP-binding domain protein [Diaphorina citri cimodo-like virus]